MERNKYLIFVKKEQYDSYYKSLAPMARYVNVELENLGIENVLFDRQTPVTSYIYNIPKNWDIIDFTNLGNNLITWEKEFNKFK
jgi:hypothetical protein